MFGEILEVNTHKSDGKCIENIEKTPIERGIPTVYNFLTIEEGQTPPCCRYKALEKK